MTDHFNRRGEYHREPESSEDERWLERMGSKFVTVHLYVRKIGGFEGRHMRWLDERHIDDPETLDTTVSMSLERLGGRYAIWQRDGGWVLLKRGAAVPRLKFYPNREAAEMVAIHGG